MSQDDGDASAHDVDQRGLSSARGQPGQALRQRVLSQRVSSQRGRTVRRVAAMLRAGVPRRFRAGVRRWLRTRLRNPFRYPRRFGGRRVDPEPLALERVRGKLCPPGIRPECGRPAHPAAVGVDLGE